MARTVYGAHKRYMDTYLNVYKGYYFTGDGAGRDHEGFYWIRGRVDDVVNVSGHRLSTAEIEAALSEHHAVAEAAVVGVADELTGQAVNAFVAVKNGNDVSDALRKEFIMQVRKSIGPFAAPKAVHIVPDLPKTRSGKIMRRILRKILAGEEDQLGDITTVRFPSPAVVREDNVTDDNECAAVRPVDCGEDYHDCTCRAEIIKREFIFGRGRHVFESRGISLCDGKRRSLIKGRFCCSRANRSSGSSMGGSELWDKI